MKKTIFHWGAAVLVAASLGLSLSGCGSKDHKTSASSSKASSSKVVKKTKSSSKKATEASSKQQRPRVHLVKPMLAALQKRLARLKPHLPQAKPLSLQNWWELGLDLAHKRMRLK